VVASVTIKLAPATDIELGRGAIDSAIWAHGGIVLTTFETMRDYHLNFARQRFAAIIYEEAQKIKNSASQMIRSTDVQSRGLFKCSRSQSAGIERPHGPLK